MEESGRKVILDLWEAIEENTEESLERADEILRQMIIAVFGEKPSDDEEEQA